MNNDDFKEILIKWKELLKLYEKELKDKLNILFNDISANSNIFAVYFEYNKKNLNIRFKAVNDIGKEILKNDNIIPRDIIITNSVFKKYFDEQKNRNKQLFERYGTCHKEFDSDHIEFERKKCKILKKWFQKCLNKVKVKYTDIPKVYFTTINT